MTTKRTVLVLGAGASAPYGLPTGRGLSDIIRMTHIIDDNDLPELGVDRRAFHEFREILNRAGRVSIDALLETRTEYEHVGKVAIALALLPRETTHALFDDWPQRRLDPPKYPHQGKEGHWYELLFNMLTGGRKFQNIDFGDLSIVTFNYDRSLEHYFFTAIKNSYGRSEEEVAARLATMQIVHVHGSLGRLPWQPDVEMPTVPYGDKSAQCILHAASAIKVLHEAQDSSPEFEAARLLISRAKRVYFLGFGFHHVNLRRLGMEYIEPTWFVGGTANDLTADAVIRATHFKFFENHRIDDSTFFEPKDVYVYLHDNVSFSD